MSSIEVGEPEQTVAGSRGEAESAEEKGPGPRSPTGGVAARTLARRLATVRRRLRLAAEKADEDVEHVHALRVSTRRATAALALYGELLPRRAARWMARELRRIRRAADRARDADVLLERMLADPEAARAEALLVRLRSQRRDAQRPIAEAYRRGRGERFAAAARELWRGASRGGRASKRPFEAFARSALEPIEARFFAATPGAPVTIGALHELRIRAKELRYAMELAAPALPPELPGRVVPILHALQDQLGAINDHAKALDCFHGALALRSSDAELMSKLAGDEAAHLTRSLATLREWWSKERSEALRQALHAALEAEDAASPAATTHLH